MKMKGRIEDCIIYIENDPPEVIYKVFNVLLKFVGAFVVFFCDYYKYIIFFMYT